MAFIKLLAAATIFASITGASELALAQDHDHDHDHGKKKKTSSSTTEKKSTKQESAKEETKKDEHEHEHHHHEAPHDGTLILFGNEFAHLELVHDSKEGKLTGYVLDGEAAKAIRISQPDIVLEVAAEKGSTFTLTLKPVESVLTGEKAGACSEFAAEEPKLKGLKKFEAVLKEISIKGTQFKGVEFPFPEGNH